MVLCGLQWIVWNIFFLFLIFWWVGCIFLAIRLMHISAAPNKSSQLWWKNDWPPWMWKPSWESKKAGNHHIIICNEPSITACCWLSVQSGICRHVQNLDNSEGNWIKPSKANICLPDELFLSVFLGSEGLVLPFTWEQPLEWMGQGNGGKETTWITRGQWWVAQTKPSWEVTSDKMRMERLNRNFFWNPLWGSEQVN